MTMPASAFMAGQISEAADIERATAKHGPTEALRAGMRPSPCISIEVFCEHSSTAEMAQAACHDRRLAKVRMTVRMGGLTAAVAHYSARSTPNLIVVESLLARTNLLSQLERLAETSDAKTKVIVIGHANDARLYRELLQRGVSDYLVAPVSPLQLMSAISDLFNNADAAPLGSIVAFIGAKGGIGSSTICHNVAWTISELFRTNVTIADFDLAFGTASLDFNQDPRQGIADAIANPERLDGVLLDRLLTTCSERLSIFAAPGMLDRDYEISPDACDTILDVVRQSMPFVAADLPHVWAPWVKRILLHADEVVITAAPDLANLRNAKNIIDLLQQSRRSDGPPRLVINTANAPGRPEIGAAGFCDKVGLQASAVIEFDSRTFGEAANSGQMIEELNRKARAVGQFKTLASLLTHRRLEGSSRKSPFSGFLGGLSFRGRGA